MTVLCVSVRNQRTRFGLFDGGRPRAALGRLAPIRGEPRTSGGCWSAASPGTTTPWLDGAGVCISSTVPVVLHELRVMTSRLLPGRPRRGRRARRAHRPAGPDGQPARGRHRPCRQRPRRGRPLGRTTASSSTLGTATTFEVRQRPRPVRRGRHRARRRRSSLDALGSRGAQLRQVELERPRTVIAKNTVEALQSGAVLRLRRPGRRSRRADRRRARGRADARVVATGELDNAVIDACTSITDTEPHADPARSAADLRAQPSSRSLGQRIEPVCPSRGVSGHPTSTAVVDRTNAVACPP